MYDERPPGTHAPEVPVQRGGVGTAPAAAVARSPRCRRSPVIWRGGGGEGGGAASTEPLGFVLRPAGCRELRARGPGEIRWVRRRGVSVGFALEPDCKAAGLRVLEPPALGPRVWGRRMDARGPGR